MMRRLSSCFATLAVGLAIAGSSSLAAATVHPKKTCNPAPYLPPGADGCTRPCAAGACPVINNVCVCPQALPGNGCAGTNPRDCSQYTMNNAGCFMASCASSEEGCPAGQVRCYWQLSAVNCGTIPSVVTCSQL